MTINIYNRAMSDVQSREIDEETDFYLYTNLHGALDNMDNSYARNEKDEHKYFFEGYDREQGSMYLGFEVQQLCDEARKAAQSYIEEVAHFFNVEVAYIDHIKFLFF